MKRDEKKPKLIIDELGEHRLILISMVMGARNCLGLPLCRMEQKRRFLNSDEDRRVWIDGTKTEQVFSFFKFVLKRRN